MRIISAVAATALVVLGGQVVNVQAEVVIETVRVGNPGNAGELSGEGAGGDGSDAIVGGVDYVYNIGKYEVTAGQYTEFLNAVVATSMYELYSTRMAYPTAWRGCNIQRSGSPGSYSYSIAPDWADRPVNWVHWEDAARFANWLHNGQPTGVQDASTTEDGAYDMSLGWGVVRKPGARVFLPNEDEWYKAAYHKNDGVTGNYFDYPTSSDSVPSNDLVEPDPGNNATFRDSGGNSGYTIFDPYWRTEVGAHENSDSPYGTFDQGGNVLEWNETLIGSYRGLRGGSFFGNDDILHAAFRYDYYYPAHGSDDLGFRVAEVPQPGPNVPTVPEWGLVAMALLVLTAGTLVWGRRLQPARSPG